MFGLSQGSGTNTGTPDVCLTPAGPAVVPVPYVNIQMSSVTTAAVYDVLIDSTPALNQSSIGAVSSGDEPGVATGVVSHLIVGQTNYQVGCLTVLTDGMPQQRLTSVTGQNAAGMVPNTVGVTSAPSQVSVLTLG